MPILTIVPDINPGNLTGTFHHFHVLIAVALTERPVVKEIVADVNVGHRSLWRGGLESRMSVHCGNGSEPTVIRATQDSDAPTVVRNVFDQPIDRVVSIRAFVYIDFFLARRTREHELACGSVTPAYILKNENVTVLNEGEVALVDCIGRRFADSVRRSVENQWNAFSLIFRCQDQR